MTEIYLFTLASVLIISIVSLVGIVFVGLSDEKLKKILIYMVSFSAGALFADVFIHLLPETTDTNGKLFTPLILIGGLVVSFALEKIIHWHHCHLPHGHDHAHPFAIMNLVGDTLHNFIDGMIIAASYLVSIPAGIATTVAVVFHEIPQEIGDFGVLLHGGFSKKKAILMNLITALSAIVGAIIVLVIGTSSEHLTAWLIPFAAGNFIYIAGSDLIPQLHKEEPGIKSALWQLTWFCLGVAIIAALILVE
ncbi:MAG: hypothetical protein A3J93_05550 [Candidatus Magasanikbacteria bacterium RIFOXYC2_FULL_42_28]|uniref:ZIP family metal transporter n=1 Tax=Candidatus Magasanikbacteria bacterium RIFOXYC2_FULL_42_28 TaxID=1798704 RepID=A0A1F6NWA2_9BACT|nr:MAG: hypothetical protein A3J93_05550 [Candidatus Magasanikbacteria bacterium RIFOXYC2_FULL_42_28]